MLQKRYNCLDYLVTSYCQIERKIPFASFYILSGASQVVLVVNAEDTKCRFDPWVGKIPWKRVWQPTPVFLSGEYHGQRSLMGYSL